jgi:ribosomal protein L37AE/L43A
MDEIQDYFVCDSCSSKDFKLVYNFSLRFHGVNFSDDLIYERLKEEIYECTECKKAFTGYQIEEGLDELKKRRRRR